MNALKLSLQFILSMGGAVACLSCLILLIALLLAYLVIAIVTAVCLAPFGIIYRVLFVKKDDRVFHAGSLTQ